MGTPPPPGGEGAEQSRACGRSSWSSSAGAAPCSPLARSSAASSSVTGVPCSQGQGFSSNCLHSCCLDHGCEHIFPPSFPPTPPLGWNFQMHLCIAFNCVLHNESFFCLSESGGGFAPYRKGPQLASGQGQSWLLSFQGLAVPGLQPAPPGDIPSNVLETEGVSFPPQI